MRGSPLSRRIVGVGVVLLLGVAACADDGAATAQSTSTVTTTAPASATTQATTATTPIATTSTAVSPPTTLSLAAQQKALAVAEAYVAAFNAGDADTVMGLFTPDVSIIDGFEGEWTVTDWEMRLTWDIAQGTILTAANCTVAEASSQGAVTVICESGTHNASAQAIGAPPVPTTLTFLVVPEGIRELGSIYEFPYFLATAGPMLRWLRGSHPEDADRVGLDDTVGFDSWDSVEEAEQNGLLFAQYAREWAAFLDGSGCVYPDICFRILTEG